MNTRVRLTWTGLAARTALMIFSVALPATASAETSLASGDGWEIFANGRVNVFHSYAYGNAFPNNTYDAAGATLWTPTGGGLYTLVGAERPPSDNPQQLAPGTLKASRVRSGFSSNVFGFGVRRQLTESTKVTAYMSVWAVVESEARRKYFPVPADVREGFMKFEGPWGSFLAGRALTLFSRGATEITFMYGFAFGLGYPGSIDNVGPGAGSIGFGVLANGFAAGMAYATPKVAGFQLSVGYYDPANLAGSAYERTNWGRPEAELTYDLKIGTRFNMHLFANGGYQKVYQGESTNENTVYGTGYGGRFEFGPVHLGLAGHFGKGLGLYYALDGSPAVWGSDLKQFRTFDGYYGQLQVVLGKFDLAAGYGITRVVAELPSDKVNPISSPGADAGISVIKSQQGTSAGITYHIKDYLALEVDYFRADFRWYRGEKQVVNFINSGITMLW